MFQAFNLFQMIQYDNKPNTKRILNALTTGFLKDKWTKDKIGTNFDLYKIFCLFLAQEEV